MQFNLIKKDISDKEIETVSARDIHRELKSKKDFSNWVKLRIKQGGFQEDIDYIVFTQKGENPLGGRPIKEYYISVDMARHLGMMERNEQGKKVRQYFIDIEKEQFKPEPLAIPQQTTTNRLADIREAASLLELFDTLNDSDRLHYSDSVRNATQLMLPQSIEILPVTISSRVIEIGLKATMSQLIAIGKVMAKAYRKEYDKEPHTHTQYVQGAARQVKSYTTEHLEIMDSSIKSVLDD